MRKLCSRLPECRLDATSSVRRKLGSGEVITVFRSAASVPVLFVSAYAECARGKKRRANFHASPARDWSARTSWESPEGGSR